MWTLLLSLLVVAQPPASTGRSCSEVLQGNLDNGYYRCQKLPFEVRFADEAKTVRPEKSSGTSGNSAQRTLNPADAAGIAHQVHEWDLGDTAEKALESATMLAVSMVADKPEVTERGMAGPQYVAKLRADVGGVQVTGEARASLVGGHAVALIVWGPKGGRYAPGSAAAKAFFDSLKPVTPVGQAAAYLHEGMEVSLPPDFTFVGEDRRAVPGMSFLTTRPVGVLAVTAVNRGEDWCERVTDIPSAMVASEDLSLEAPTLTPVTPARGRGFLVEGALPSKWVPMHVTHYLYCDGKTWPVRVVLFTPEPHPDAVNTVRTVAESVTGPARWDVELRVAMTGNYWPLHSQTHEVCDGLEMDIAGLLARELGKKQVICYPRQNLGGLSPLEAVAKGKTHVALSAITPTDERRKLADLTQPYVTLRHRLARRDAPEVKTLAELAGKTVAVPSGPGEPAVRAALVGATITPVKSTSEALKLLRSGAAQYVAAEDVGLLELLEGPAETLTGPPVAPSPVAMAVPKGEQAKFDAILKKLAPELEALREKYRPGEPLAELGFFPCEAEKPVWSTVELTTMRFRHDAPPARATQKLGVSGDEKFCVSEPFRVADEVPSKSLRAEVRKQLTAHAKALNSETPELNDDTGPTATVSRVAVKVDWNSIEKWGRLPGLWLNVAQLDVKQRCVIAEDDPYEQRFDCSRRRYVAVLIRGNQVVTELLKADLRSESE
jgi:ABC-type amino acid transport substrate-binding protein